MEHDPGPRGSPQWPHAPEAGMSKRASDPVPPTAKADSSFCRSAPAHDGHAGDWPSRVRYSK